MAPLSQSSVLLTSEAVRSFTLAPEVDAVDGQAWAGASRSEMGSAFVNAFLRFHATEGRERLRGWLVDVWALGEVQADELITGMFGEPQP